MTKKGITYVHVHVQHVRRSKNCQKSNQNITKKAPKITDFVAKLPKFCRKIYRLFSRKLRQFFPEKLVMWYGDHICPTWYQLLWPEPNGSGVVASLWVVAERRGSHQKFQNLIAEVPITSNLTSEFITFASLYGTNSAPTQEVGTKWFRGYTELIRGHRAARVVPKVSEFYDAGAESLKSHIRIHQKHTYIGTNRFFMFQHAWILIHLSRFSPVVYVGSVVCSVW